MEGPTKMESGILETAGFSEKYAGFWRRLLAYIVDSIILNVGFFILAVVFNPLLPGQLFDYDQTFSPISGSLQLFSIIATWLYFAFFESSKYQGTPGKLLLNIKVTDLEGRQISFKRATGRHFGKILSALILGIGFIMIAFTEKKQGLHDKLAQTLVVRDPEQIKNLRV